MADAEKCDYEKSGFKDFSRTSKRLSYYFKDWKLKKNTDLHIKILLRKC